MRVIKVRLKIRIPKKNPQRSPEKNHVVGRVLQQWRRERIEIWHFHPAEDVIEQIFHDIAVRIERHGDVASFAREEMKI